MDGETRGRGDGETRGRETRGRETRGRGDTGTRDREIRRLLKNAGELFEILHKAAVFEPPSFVVRSAKDR